MSGAGDHGAVVQRRASRREGETDVRQAASGVELVRESLGLSGKGVCGVGRDRPCDDGQLRLELRLLGRRAGLFDDHVGVRAADAERRHRAPPDPGSPLTSFGEQLDRARAPVDVRRRRVDVQCLRHDAVADGLHDLDHAADARGRLRVADVGLERAEPQGLLAVLTVGRQQSLRLDRVAQLGAGAVPLDEVDVLCRQIGGRERLADHALLRRSIGDGQAAGRAIGVDGAAADHREDGVAEPLGVGQSLDDEHPGALAPARAVGARGESLAAAVVRQAALLGEIDEGLGGGHHGHAADQGQRAVAATQRLRGPVQRDQRGRTGGVHRNRGAFQAERVGDAAGDDAAGGGVAEVVVVHHAGEHAGAAAPQGLGHDAGAFQRGPGRLQQQPLLRVHGQGLAR